jgi:cytochrome d ubiquinol oxidase subunit I
VAVAPLSVVALIAGWVVTEVGRQPWVVYHVMSTAAAVTGAHGIPVAYGALAASYLVVASGLAWVLRRLARAPLELSFQPSRPSASAQLEAA